MALSALQLHNEGTVQVVIGRVADFFGPGVLNSAMGERQIGFSIQGKNASLIGNIDVPHTFTHIQDMGKTLVTLAEHEYSFGQVWHAPNAKTVTQREFITIVFKTLGKKSAFTRMGKTMMHIGGLFIPEVRETVEMMYEFEKPFIIDSIKFEQTFQGAPLH